MSRGGRPECGVSNLTYLPKRCDCFKIRCLMISHTFHQKKTLLPRPSHVITPTKFIHVALRRFCARILWPFVHFFANLEPNLQPQLHMKPFITNPPPTQNLQKLWRVIAISYAPATQKKAPTHLPQLWGFLGIPCIRLGSQHLAGESLPGVAADCVCERNIGFYEDWMKVISK